MKFSRLSTAAVAALAASPAAAILGTPDAVDKLASKALATKVAYEAAHGANSTCTIKNAAVRREWSSLAPADRKKYTDAVLCLMSLPPKSDPSFAPGARNRFDDFVAVHINQTLWIHGTGNFLTWHRLFTWAYETALRDECGYEGYQPYWAWNKYVDNPINSPLFDGTEYSMSGNGDYVPHNDTPVTDYTTLPAGVGGGCVRSGPFANMTVNLGPVDPTLQIPGLVAQNGTGLDYNPRCLRRDISPVAAQGWTKTSDVMDLIQNCDDISCFEWTMQGFFEEGFLGVHTAGHFTIGGDPGGDLYTSPGDPAFYVHHGMIDRVFWIWQNLNPANRTYVVKGPDFIDGLIAGPNTTIHDTLWMGNLTASREIYDILDTTAGTPLCYIYL
ncbi:tyrosinase family protein [Aspergillus saccharolyticus JOP 1030-1]|uniref:Tyrosinase n=1 Tax=Aspergillus saccharolyticus JOP 1030-1 TaxID=1450539 RepID=A0A318ZJ67_9EURO|nr:tyrosinase [Aspergillus saccharolyticus JOP 1030-1]PYH43760.1 tyrosinase [Aspergillus saccharolyticus JOP 1030-1]